MKPRDSFQRRFLTLMISVLLLGSAAWAGTEKTLHSFSDATGDGPTGVIFDAAGNLYGTTFEGGSKTCNNNEFGCGVVFEMSPQANGDWTYTVIYEFTGGSDGLHPNAPLVFDSAGNLYGTTNGPIDTNASYGTVYKLSPNGDGTWSFTLLYTFPGGNGGRQPSWLVIDGAGNLYGTTFEGGSYGWGIVYELSPTTSGPWKVTLVHDFTGCQDGGYPMDLAFDAVGNLYGTAQLGGVKCAPSSGGTIFQLTPNSNGVGWHENTLLSLDDGTSGGDPQSLIFDAAGNMYGLMSQGGKNSLGAAFKMTRNANGKWNETILHNFNGQNGYEVESLILASNGEFYGTSRYGGLDYGLVYELENKAGAPETIVYQFSGEPPDGYQPSGPIVMDQSGNIYGASSGGATGAGAIFEITP
jgi:uncharacterized repeat protein (TIGR03803 family)